MSELSLDIASLIRDVELYHEVAGHHTNPRVNEGLRAALDCLSSARRHSLIPDKRQTLMELFAQAAFHFRDAREIVRETASAPCMN